MDTKSKNIKYSNTSKFIGFIICVITIVSFIGSIVYMGYNEDFVRHRKFEDTYTFRSEYGKVIGNVLDYYVDLVSETSIQEKYKDEAVIASKIRDYQRIKKMLEQNVNVLFQLKNLETGEVISNIPKDESNIDLESMDAFTYYVNEDINELNGMFSYNGRIELLSEGKYELKAAVRSVYQEGDELFYKNATFRIIKSEMQYAFVIGVIGFVMGMLSLIYLGMVAGRTAPNSPIKYLFMDDWLLEIHVCLMLLLIGASGGIISTYDGIDETYYLFTAIATIGTLNLIFVLSFVLSMIRQIKGKRLFQNTLLYKGSSKVKHFTGGLFKNKLFNPWFFAVILGYWLITLILFVGMTDGGDFGGFLSFVLLVILNVFVLRKIYNFLKSLKHIIDGSAEVANGHHINSLEQMRVSDSLKELKQNVLNIQVGINQAVEQALKGEQMKTALITNVSHDLKTPLTSIITYVDLLKNENLENPKAVEYIEVLNDKSYRLKHLIEDIIEVNKASTGNMSVKNEKINLNELLQQAKGEFEVKIQESTLDFRIQEVEQSVYIEADSNMMWRIFENIFENALKYSADNSRVYLNVEYNHGMCEMTLKNMSKEPLDILPTQLTERFVRGDDSRTTDGSGLGLSIAQSLAVLQSGEFEVSIDGDLFKVNIKMPLWNELKNAGINMDKK